jgi:hypothetical protein
MKKLHENANFQDLLIQQIGEEMALLAMLEMIIVEGLTRDDLDIYFAYRIEKRARLLSAMFLWSSSQQGAAFWAIIDNSAA